MGCAVIVRECPWCSNFAMPDPGTITELTQEGDRLILRQTRPMWELSMLAHVRVKHSDRLMAEVTDEMAERWIREETQAAMRSVVDRLTSRR